MTDHRLRHNLTMRQRTLLASVAALCFVLLPLMAAARGRADSTQSAQVMGRVFGYASRNFLNDVQFSSDVYVRQRLHTVRRGQVVRYLPHMFRLERGTNDYLTEARLKVQYRPPGEVDCKVVAFTSTASLQRSSRLNLLSQFSFQIYAPRLFGDRLLNPLNRRNRRFYRYTYAYAGSLDGTPTAHILITPRFPNAQLVDRGEVDVDVATGAVRKFRFGFTSRLQHFVVSGRAGTGYYDSVLPVSMRVLTNFRLLGNRVSEVYDIYASYSFSCPLPFARAAGSGIDLTRQCLLRIDTARVITDRAHFDSIRPIPLRRNEAAIYRRKDSLDAIAYGNSLPVLLQRAIGDSLAQCEREGRSVGTFRLPEVAHEAGGGSERLRDALLSSHQLGLGDAASARVRFPALLSPSMVQWSGSKGLSLQAQVRISADFSSFDGGISFDPRVGYSFKQRQVYWTLPLSLRFWPRMDAAATVEASGGSHIYSSRQADEVRGKLTGAAWGDSLLAVFNKYDFNYYLDKKVKADVAFSFVPAVRLTVGLRYHDRRLLEWNEAAQMAQLHRRLNSLAPRVQLELTPQQYYYRDGLRRVPLYSRFPTFILGYERGFSLASAPTAYERLEADVRYRLPLYALRTLYFRAGYGVFTRRLKECFLDYDFFRFNNMPARWDDEMTGEFQLLNARWYNESRYYWRLTSTYESPMLLFSRLPWLSRLVQTERVYCNVLSLSLMKLYAEFGYGIGTDLVDFGVFTSCSSHRDVGFGFRCAFHLFDY